MVVTAGISPLVAWFYHDPRLLLVTIAIAGGFIFGGLTVQHQALLSRRMKFKALAIIEISALLVGILTAVICSLLGMKYWSLVFMQIANAFTAMAGSWIASGWMPGLPKKGSGVRPMLAFGGNLTIFNFVNYFARNLDNILIGKFWGALQAGLYSKAYSLLLMPLGQITAPMTSVAIPALSRLQNDPERYSNYYLKAIKLIAYLSMPLVVVMEILSKEIVIILLGNQWLGAIPIFRILVICAFWQPICSTVGWIFISLGQTRRMAQWGIITSIFFSISFIAGLHWGAIGVAIGYTVAVLTVVYPQFSFALKYSPVKVKYVFMSIFRPSILSCIAGASVFMARIFLYGLNELLIIGGSVLFASIAILFTILLWRGLKKDMIDMISMVKFAIKKPV